jgi:hypothetical protein
MFFAGVTHPVEGLSFETLLTLKVEKSNVLVLSVYTETNSTRNRATVNFVLVTVNKK